MRNLPPRKALPDCEAYRNCWIEVTTGGSGTRDDGERDAQSKCPTDLKDAAEGCNAERVCSIKREGSNSCDTGKSTK